MPADSHCHLNNPAFADDLPVVVRAVEEAGIVALLNVGYDLATSERAIELAHLYHFMFAAVGVHPHHAGDVDDATIATLREWGARPEVVAIGETGLDYYRNRSPKDAQERSFRAHLAIARALNKPVIVHCRDAMDDCLRILEEESVGEFGGVMHCFAGTPADVRRVLNLGMYISFAGNVTYPSAQTLRDSLVATPGHRLLIETDAPYLTPAPHRGKRNDPTMLTHIVELAAELRGVTRADIERLAMTNFDELFRTGRGFAGEVAYRIRNSVYLNVTQSCTNECFFCVRYHSDSVQGHNLRLPKDPTADEMFAAIGDPTACDEVVFCGYGEPTIRLTRIKEVARRVKAAGGRVRLNTNGHGSHLAKRNIAPELVGLVDEVSVSLNGADAATYDAVCKPLIPHAWETTVAFIRDAKAAGLSVTATVVAIPNLVDVEAARRFAEDDLGVKFRVRPYDLVG
ncbi:MAG: YchF/TatD family DNA exonuclease [Nitrospinae bacterium]|nr:YchF/TatD family DNA exonuclease [Nitrospinota bacterium]